MLCAAAAAAADGWMEKRHFSFRNGTLATYTNVIFIFRSFVGVAIKWGPIFYRYEGPAIANARLNRTDS